VPNCFIAMPVSTLTEHARLYGDDEHFKHVLTYLMVPAVEKAGYEAIKPIAEGADVIHAEIIRQLETADMVLCDISTLNPNVFFELGVRTAVDKPVCVLRDMQTDRIPFDMSIINVHTYEPSLAPWLLEDQVSQLALHLQASAQRSDNRNTLWRYFGLTTKAAFKEGESSLEEKVDLVLLQLRGFESQAPLALLRRDAGAGFEADVARSVHGYPKDIATGASEFVDEAQKITRARIKDARFGDFVLLITDGPVSPAERVELGRLGARHRTRVYVDEGRVLAPPAE
jgi:hypothetical protein